jgi:hypothetical protein
MKTSSIAFIVALAALSLLANSASAVDQTSGAMTGRRMYQPATTAPGMTCPPGQTVSTNPATGKQSCVLPGMAVKGSGVPQNTTTGPKPKYLDQTTPQ